MILLRILGALIAGVSTFIGCIIIVAVAYNDLNSPYDIVVAVIGGLLTLIICYRIIVIVYKRGFISVASERSASSELDHLIVEDEYYGVVRLKPENYLNFFSSADFTLDKVTIAIWGDQNGRKLKNQHRLLNVEYDEAKEVLTFHFKNDYTLKVRKPERIVCATTYLKITKAREVLWQIKTKTDKIEQYSYLRLNGDIQTKSNTDWKPYKYDLGIGMDAVYLQV